MSCGISLTAPSVGSSQSSPQIAQIQGGSLFGQNGYIIDKKILALRDTFGLKTSQGELIGYIKKKMVSMGPQFWFEDLNGQHFGEIHGKILTIHHTYEIYNASGEKVGLVNKKIMKLFGTEWWLEAPPGQEAARVQGNILNHDYFIQDTSKRPLAQVHKKWVSVRDSYCLELLDPGFDRLLALGFAIAMDSVEFEEH